MMAGSMAARCGGALSPVVLWALQGYSPGSSYLVFGLLSLCGTVALRHLPEALGCDTLETVGDLHALIDTQQLQKRRRGASHSMALRRLPATSTYSHGSSDIDIDIDDDDDDDDDDDNDVPLLR